MIENVEIIRKDIKSIYLVVNPDCSVVLKAPLSVPDEFIKSYLKKKEFWIEKQINQFKESRPNCTEKRYVSGESFNYLGKSYRLKVHKSEEERVSLYRGYLHLYIKNKEDTEHKKKLVDKWYRSKAEGKLSEIFNEHYAKITDDKPELAIRSMKRRWGSCNFEKNKILLNPKLIEKPKYCIEYVVFHELTHLKYPNHNKDFYYHLTYLMPDWEWRRERLNEN